jgi:hypothetical protein
LTKLLNCGLVNCVLLHHDTRIVDEAVDVARQVVWATVTTVSPTGRPLGRILHPVWTVGDDGCTGWVITRPTPVKTRHLAANPHVSCAYLAANHDIAFFDCVATWVDDAEQRRRAWHAIATAPPPVGYDPATIFPAGIDSPDWSVLQLSPFRIQVARGAALAKGARPLLWLSA